MTLSLTAIREAVAREFPSASQEIQNFVNWLEQKDAQIASAKALLEQNGYTVTPK